MSAHVLQWWLLQVSTMAQIEPIRHAIEVPCGV